MTVYQDLSEFESGVIFGTREMGHSTSEVAMKFRFSRVTISRVYRQYRESGKTSNLRHRCGRKKLYTSPLLVNNDVGVLRTAHKLPGLTSLVSNLIELMDVYGYGNNLMNPWTLHVNRGLFNLGDSLMQNNATPHTFRIATDGFQEHSSEFRHYRWSPKSPDMNNIQHIWDALRRAVQKRSPPPLTSTDF
ncbi:DDE_3 domain-containing protein [Trichonephila clavipes]|nr:DDE_3 domain-containing protein [Trichonephila clavipes]